MAIPGAMGTAIAINFQPTGDGKAAITGDFVALAGEVNPLIKALRDNGIEVTAIHNHMLDDEPRAFFVHFWANDDAVKLAKGLRAGLDAVHVAAEGLGLAQEEHHEPERLGDIGRFPLPRRPYFRGVARR